MSLTDRLNHKFIGTFTISTILLNYDIFLLAFSGDLIPNDRIKFISELINERGFVGLFAYPLGFAIGYVILKPILDLGIFSFDKYIEIQRGNVDTFIYEKNENKFKSVKSEVYKSLDKYSHALNLFSGNFRNNDKDHSEKIFKNLCESINSMKEAIGDVDLNKLSEANRMSDSIIKEFK